MTRVDIDFEGPVMEGLCTVTVTDPADSDEFHLDHADVEAARASGPQAAAELLGLVLENCGTATGDMLRAALVNGSPVAVDGEDVPHDVVRAALGAPAPGL